MSRYDYLINKITTAEIRTDPFPHIYVGDFLNRADFKEVVDSREITFPPANNLDDLFAALDGASYEAIDFPGCTKSRSDYVSMLQAQLKPLAVHGACEGMGMAFRCTSPKSDAVRELDAFFRSENWSDAIAAKFGIARNYVLDSGLQKYLDRYEISPHPDIRRKALTWMLNVNPGEDAEALDIHTHYMRFKPEWDFIREFWQKEKNAETCWVPWDWCDTVSRQVANNSIVLFAPRFDTLHAIRANYDHLASQRTQFYGNLWYKPYVLPHRPQYTDFSDGGAPVLSSSPREMVKSLIRNVKSRFADWAPAR